MFEHMNRVNLSNLLTAASNGENSSIVYFLWTMDHHTVPYLNRLFHRIVIIGINHYVLYWKDAAGFVLPCIALFLFSVCTTDAAMLSLYWSYSIDWELECNTVVLDAPNFKLITFIWLILPRFQINWRRFGQDTCVFVFRSLLWKRLRNLIWKEGSTFDRALFVAQPLIFFQWNTWFLLNLDGGLILLRDRPSTPSVLKMSFHRHDLKWKFF
jgi:hypothetical protein